MNKTLEQYKDYYINATKEEVLIDTYADIKYLINIINQAIDYIGDNTTLNDFQLYMLIDILNDYRKVSL